MAIASKRDGLNDWSLSSDLGAQPNRYTTTTYFYIEGTGPVPSNTANNANRRSWRENLRRNMECPVGQSMCATGIKGRLECRDVSKDIYCKSPLGTVYESSR